MRRHSMPRRSAGAGPRRGPAPELNSPEVYLGVDVSGWVAPITGGVVSAAGGLTAVPVAGALVVGAVMSELAAPGFMFAPALVFGAASIPAAAEVSLGVVVELRVGDRLAWLRVFVGCGVLLVVGVGGGRATAEGCDRDARDKKLGVHLGLSIDGGGESRGHHTNEQGRRSLRQCLMKA